MGRAIVRRRRGRVAAHGRSLGDVDGSWKNAFVGGGHELVRTGTRLVDART
jgi:hypothetical protein